MATIRYQFSDGHYEDVECSDDFKNEYEFILLQEKAIHWKEMKQKQRASMRCAKDISLDKIIENGYEFASLSPNPIDIAIQMENKQFFLNKILRSLTIKQREVFILHYIKGIPNLKIAQKLNIDESSVRERLYWAKKKISKKFKNTPEFIDFLSTYK